VTLTGVDDDLDDGDVNYTIVTAAAVSDDVSYSGLNPEDVSVTNMDDEPKLQVTSLEPTASGFVAHLSQLLDVTVLSLYDVEAGRRAQPTLRWWAARWEPSAIDRLRRGGKEPDLRQDRRAAGAGQLYRHAEKRRERTEDSRGQSLDGDANNSAGGTTRSASRCGSQWSAGVAAGFYSRAGSKGGRTGHESRSAAASQHAAGIESVDVTIRYNPAMLRITDAVVGRAYRQAPRCWPT